ncbi:MAG: SIS domain-containing protein [Fibrobacterota bacterium]
MSKLTEILSLSDEEKKSKGLTDTPREINQQPGSWRKTVQILKDRKDELKAFLDKCGIPGGMETRVVLSGAGTSEFIGHAVEGPMRADLNVDVDCRASTDCVTHFDKIFLPGRNYLAVHFARSGNSPESVGTFDIVKKKVPGAKQLAITCNKNGALAKAAVNDDNVFALILPDETNDESLVMTSSFSSMAVAAMGLAYVANDTLDEYEKIIENVSKAGQTVLDSADKLFELGSRPWERGAFLGSGSLFGTGREGHLKLSEMTEGKVMCRYDSFVGLRHGPQVVIKNNSFVMAHLSNDPFVLKYETDLLKELRQQNHAGAIFVTAPQIPDEIKEIADDYIEMLPGGEKIDDKYRVPCDIVASQLLGLFKSMDIGLRPDNPSEDGTINRVVQGVKIYDIEAFEKDGSWNVIAG